MTRKHFQALATALLANRPRPTGDDDDEEVYRLLQWRSDCRAIAGACSDINTRFDLDRFLTACGYGDVEVSLNHTEY